MDLHMLQDVATLRNGEARVEAIVKAYDAAMANVLTGYRMAAFARPFGGGPKYWHLILNGRRLSLCHGLAAGRTTALRRVDLAEVDCVDCLDAFTEMTRP